ncbi:YafY family transcriptional regulator [Rhodococcus sp. D2-41]|uniref:helix-turn-helix transcriptional regulator n=1 Tax=Speluncibacter jeojiensis TaxID=2710754 RepID=UPI0024105471|nr:YafY family protein [Rhodococcus sp. D2-41]MDG3011128.1 YafY family transcriptional regulator [Rhodococcus sp. D2-41]
MSARLTDRLVRLINLVPYFITNEGISKTEAAAELGITPAELAKDLTLLWMCGLPGHAGGDLIDLAMEEDTVTVTFSAGIDRPLRLTSTEATVLLMALRALVDQPSSVDPVAASSAIAKIEQAAGIAAGGLEGGAVADADPVLTTVRSAVTAGHALRLRYFSASRDAITDRVVDPIRIRLVEDQSYLQAWCRKVEGVRLFRFDRIEDATELDEPARAHPEATDLAASEALLQGGIFGVEDGLPVARLHLARSVLWVLDYYPMDVLREEPDGSVEVQMRYATTEWMARLILGFGGAATVLDPPELREDVRARARAALDLYT